MTIRFFVLQAQYRSTLDFSNEALQASEKALQRMLEGWKRLQDLKASESSSIDVSQLKAKCYEALDDDLNTPIVIAHLFEACRLINLVNDGNATATAQDIETLKELFNTFMVEILGIRTEIVAGAGNADAMRPFEEAIDLLLQIRSEAKAKKDWATSDLIRNRLAEIGFNVKDTKDGFEWSLK
jgi:cysteinyl-tRNA synthetase